MKTDLPPFRAPLWLRSAHLQTILPSLFRHVPGVAYRRERIELEDGDFLDLDRIPAVPGRSGPRRVAVVTHGLEGDANRSYVRGMARALARRGWDVVALNLRGCSGEPNRLARAYHSGATEDLDAVVQHVLGEGYEAVALVGFSLGGNLTLRYLGERGGTVDPHIVGAAVFSVPCDLAAASVKMGRRGNRIYMRRFLRQLGQKLAGKAERFPEAVAGIDVRRMRSFQEFDDAFTAPQHGFKDAADYWSRASAGPVVPDIRVPTLLVNAQDDPFLVPSCTPHAAARANPEITLLTPRHGGHVGFAGLGLRGWADEFWSERVAAAYLDRVLAAPQPEAAEGPPETSATATPGR